MSYSKYRAKKTFYNSKVYDSKKEAARACELQILEKSGIIKDLKEQVPFVICPRIENVKGSRARKYIADFVYLENGNKVIEDCKSSITKRNPVYTLKKQLVMYLYPEYIFKET